MRRKNYKSHNSVLRAVGVALSLSPAAAVSEQVNMSVSVASSDSARFLTDGVE